MVISFAIRVILLGVLIIPVALRAQTIISFHSADSGALHAVQLYRGVIGTRAGLYNGFQYNEDNIHHYDIGHPYFQSDDWLIGAVHYDGQYYAGIDMMYDLVNDKVIVGNSSGYSKLELITTKVSSFTLGGHAFVKLFTDSTDENTVRTGLYDVLYDGAVKVYALRKKEVEKKLENRLSVKTFKEKNTYFVYKAGSYYRVRNKSSVLKVFRNQKSALRKKLAQNKIRFHKSRELSIALMAGYYDESVKQP